VHVVATPLSTTCPTKNKPAIYLNDEITILIFLSFKKFKIQFFLIVTKPKKNKNIYIG
jgi:hypothetical protein